MVGGILLLVRFKQLAVVGNDVHYIQLKILLIQQEVLMLAVDVNEVVA